MGIEDAAALHVTTSPSAPYSRHGHVVVTDSGGQLLTAADVALYDLDADQTNDLRKAELGGDGALSAAVAALGVDQPAPPNVQPEPIRALALTVAQSCNLACTYCYADGGDFGGAKRQMSEAVAEKAIDRLIQAAPPGGAVKIAFMGGEPLIARKLIRHATAFAIRRAARRAVRVGLSITTNGTLVTKEDASFFADHRFAVTVSMDGGQAVQDALRPNLAGRGSFARIAERLGPLFAVADKVALGARATVTPLNIEIPEIVDALGALGFSKVGISPLLTSPTGDGVLDQEHFSVLLEQMIKAGDAWLEARLAGRDHPFANLETALVELDRGKPKAVACGAARDYLAVEADGSLSACHRFVNDEHGRLGHLDTGLDETTRRDWLAAREVGLQQPCKGCWARHLCGGGCHHEVINRGRPACDYIRGWLHYAIGVYGRIAKERPALLGRQ